LSGVNFTDVSTGGTVVRRDWDLGNGTIIPNGAATVGTNYLTSQTFIVKLTVTFSNGDVKTKTDNVIVHPKPSVDFVASDTAGCVPHNVIFRDLSTTVTDTINNWTWDFGAGGSTVKSPSFVYNTAGNYNISLIVKNSCGCESDAGSRF
jgi:PKD repeat protein